MNRRKFFALLGIGGPIAVIAAKTGLLSNAHPFQNGGASSGVCTECGDAVTQHDSIVLFGGAPGGGKLAALTKLQQAGWQVVRKDGLLGLHGQTDFSIYDDRGLPSRRCIRYYLRDGGVAAETTWSIDAAYTSPIYPSLT